MIKESFKQGNFKKHRKKSLDNYELLPNLKAAAKNNKSADTDYAVTRTAGTLQASMKMSGKRQDISAATTNRYQMGQLLKPQIEPILEESGSIDNKTDGVSSSMVRPRGDNFDSAPENTDSEDESDRKHDESNM